MQGPEHRIGRIVELSTTQHRRPRIDSSRSFSGKSGWSNFALCAIVLTVASCEVLACASYQVPAQLNLKGGQVTKAVLTSGVIKGESNSAKMVVEHAKSVPNGLFTHHALSRKHSSSSHLRLRIPLNALSSSNLQTDGTFDDNGMGGFPEGSTDFVAECKLPTEKGMFRLRAYRYRGAKVVFRNGERVLDWTEMEPVVMLHGDISADESCVVRVHDQCFTSEVLGSQRCDCKEQLDMALEYIQQESGIVIYMPQEGRGIGLANKIAAYELQDTGLDTVDANRHLGFEDDERSYECVPAILKDLGVHSVKLMTNNPYKIRTLTDSGVRIEETMRSIVPPNKHNEKYLRTKALRMSHLLSLEDDDSETGAAAQSAKAVEEAAGVALLGRESVEAAAAALKAGEVVLLVEGGEKGSRTLLVAAGESASAATMVRLLRRSGGIVQAAMPAERMRRLGLEGAEWDRGMALGMGVDVEGVGGGGGSVEGRAATLQALGRGATLPGELRRGGCVFPRGVEEEGEGAELAGLEAAVRLGRVGGVGEGVVAVAEAVSEERMAALSAGEGLRLARTTGMLVTSVLAVSAFR